MAGTVCYRAGMSFYRTQYSPQIGLGGHITPGIKGLLIANVSVFVLQKLPPVGTLVRALSGGFSIEETFGLSPELGVFGHLWLWQIVTYMFLHSPFWIGHLVLNMLMLWMFGTEVERLWGTREFVKYYFICGIGAAVVTCLLFPATTTIGASGAVFGVMLAYGFLFPNRQVLIWFIFPMRAISFILVCIGIEMYSLLNVQDGVAHFAHLGGMLFGYLYLKRAWRVREFLREVRWRLRRRRFRVLKQDDEHYPYH